VECRKNFKVNHSSAAGSGTPSHQPTHFFGDAEAEPDSWWLAKNVASVEGYKASNKSVPAASSIDILSAPVTLAKSSKDLKWAQTILMVASSRYVVPLRCGRPPRHAPIGASRSLKDSSAASRVRVKAARSGLS
jgi:hypothetical protein